MKQETMIFAGAAVLGVFWLARRNAALTADDSRMAGMRQLYASNAGQMAGVNAAVAQQWASLDQTFKTQPDFYI